MKAKAIDKDILVLADKIATALFTDGSNIKAGRLVLEYRGEFPNTTGWSHSAVRDVITKALAAEK